MSRIEAFRVAMRKHRLVTILRDVSSKNLAGLVKVLVDANVRIIEIPLSDPSKAHQIGQIRRLTSPNVVVGAGTVTTVERARQALDEGAEFIVTPNVEESVIEFAADHDLGLLCGAMTPTEVARAQALGADFIKFFPASALGPAYLRALLGPYPDLEAFAVGGISSANVRGFLSAGACGAGVGGSLKSEGADGSGFDEARQEALRLTSLLES